MLTTNRIDTERAFIGCLLNGDIRARDSGLSSADFTDALCQRVFCVALMLEERGQTCDLVTLDDNASGLDIGAVIQMTQEAAVSGALVTQYAASIRTAAQRRAVSALGMSLARDAADPEKPLSELLDAARAKLDTVAGALPSSGVVDGVDACCNFLAALEAGPLEPVVRFGFPLLDRNLIIAGGKLITIGARPSVGKSALLMHLFLNALDAGRRALFVSLEMGEAELVARMVCRKSGVQAGTIEGRSLTPSDQERVVESFSLIPSDRFAICTTARTPQDVRRMALRMRARGGLDLIIVDYLQLLEPGRRTGTRTEAVGIVSRALKSLALELGIPVLTASQLNRASERNDEPLLSDLRESGSIEQDSDAVLLLHSPREKERPERDLYLAKNRQGACKKLHLLFDGARMVFAENGKGG